MIPPVDLLAQITSGTLPTGQLQIDQDFLKDAAELGKDRLDRYKLFEEYYEGQQQTDLPERARQFLEAKSPKIEWNENFCETVVDTFVARMGISGFTTSELTEPEPGEVGEDGLPPEASDELADWLQEYVWETNRLDATQAIVHLTAIQKGDAFLLVDFDNAKQCPRLTFNRPEIVKPEWDDDGNMVYCVKRWDTAAKSPTNPTGVKIQRMNIYYPDRVEKYFKLSAGGEASWSIHLDDDDVAWPTPWVDADGKPLGIPVFHFANKPSGKHWGRSELKSVIPQQNLLNKQVLDLVAIMDTMGYPQRYATGIEDAGALKTAPGEVWHTAAPGAAFGQFEAAGLDGPLGAIEATLLRIAARSRTPAHLIVLTGGAPSGESLKVSESGLTSKAKYNAVFWGDVWGNAMLMAVKLAGVYATANKPPVSDLSGVTINANWNDPETQNLLTLLQALGLMKDLGVSDRTILSKIPGIDADQELKAKEMDAQAAGGAMMDFIDSGAEQPVPVPVPA